MDLKDRWRAGAVVVLVMAATWTSGSAQEQSVTLERAIEIALNNSHDISAAEYSVRVADQQVREAWSNVLPDVSASASYSRNLKVQKSFLPAIIFDPTASPGDVIPVQFGSDNTWQAGLNLNQPLFEYNVFIGVGAANRFRSLENERMRGTTQGVVTAVRMAFLGTLLSVEEQRLLQNSVTRVQQTLEETQAMNRAGLASDYDVLRLEVELGNLVPNLRRVDNAVDEAKRQLSIELGLGPNEDVELAGSLSGINIEDLASNSDENQTLLLAAGSSEESAGFESLRGVAFEERSSLRAQRLNQDLERTRLSTQKAEYFPTLSLFSSYSILAQENGSPNFFGSSNSRAASAVTGISISVPIFQGFARDARVQQTNAVIDQIDQQLQRAEAELESELRFLVAGLDETRERVQSQQRSVTQAQRGFEIASVEYREGIGSRLQVTDAELALRQSEFNYAQAVYDYLTTRARLDSAAGTVPTAAGEISSRVDR
jgi:outer membrane protein